MEAIDEGPFLGLDTATPAELLPRGALSRADDVVLDRGHLLTRPGVRGQLTTPHGAALYSPCSYVSSGAGSVLYATGGKLYKWARGDSSATELLESAASLSIDTTSVFMAAGPNAVYLVDGTDDLRRVTLTDAETVTALSLPTAPTASTIAAAGEGSDIMPDVGDTADWTQPLAMASGTYDSSLVSLADGSFDGHTAGSLGTGGDYWEETSGGGMDATVVAGTGAEPDNTAYKYIELDADVTVPEVIQMVSAVAVPQDGEDTPIGAKLYVATAYAWSIAAPGANPQRLSAQLNLYSNAGTTLITGTDVAQYSPVVSTTATSTLCRFLIDHRDIAGDPSHARLLVGAPDAVSTTNGLNVNRITLTAPGQQFLLTAASGSLVVGQGTVQVWDGVLYTKGLQILNDAGVANNGDWSGYESIFVAMSLGSGVSDVRLRLMIYSGGVWVDGPEMDYTPDGYIASLSGVSASVLADVDGVGVEFVDDITATGFSEGGTSTVMTITGVYVSGNLAVGLPYWYKIVEIDASADATNVLDVLESDVSESSNVILPTDARRMGRLVIPTIVNSSDATHFAVYRYGGNLIDDERGAYPIGFLLGILAVGQADAAFGDLPAIGTSPYIAAPSNPYLSWDADGRVLIDNTPEGWLTGARIAYEGREAPPSAPRDVAVWDGRVWLVSGDTDLYGSWKLSSNRRAGLYFTRTRTGAAVDPHAPIRGWWGRLQIPAGDSIQTLVPAGGTLAVLTQTGLWAVRPASEEHALSRYVATRVEGAPGALSRRGAAVHEDALYWLAPDGVYRWDGGAMAERVSDPVREYLPPYTDATQAAMRLSALVSWGRRLLVVVPAESGDTAPTSALVWDSLERGWTRWTGLGASGGCVLRAPSQADALVLAGADGQVQLVTEAGGDVANAGDDPTDVTMQVRTRAVRAASLLHPRQWFFDVLAGEAGTVTLIAEGDVDAADSSKAQSVPSGPSGAWVRASHGAKGRSVRAGISGASTERLRVRRLGLELVEGVR